jgi:hypothetical protein
MCIILIILQLTNVYIEPINAVLYVIVFIFTPGFSLINILKFKPSFSRLEFVALAYPLSLTLLAIIGTITLIFPSNLRAISALLSITFLSIISLLVTIKEKQKVIKLQELIVKGHELILVIILLIFMFFFIELYPKITRIPGLDISWNYIQALAFTNDIRGDFSSPSGLYPLFNVYQSSIIYIVKPSVETFHVITIFLNLLTILSFYCMASQFLKRYGDHTPAIATLIWAMFSGFGWLNFLTRINSNSNVSFLSLIRQVDAFSYGGITWNRLFFYLSMEVSLTLVFAILYLLKRNDLNERKQFILFFFLMTPLPLMHAYAMYFLFAILLCFAIIHSQELKKTLKLAAYSLVIASFSSLVLNYILAFKAPTISMNIITFYEYLFIGLAIFSIIILKNNTPKKFIAISNRLFDSKPTGVMIVTLLLLIYFASLLFWLSGNFAFNFSDLNRFGYVPWLLFPVKLGITGILAIVAIYPLFWDKRYRSREMGAFFTSVLLMITVSRLTVTMQMQYFSNYTFIFDSWFSENVRQIVLSFREERMFELFKIPLAILASIVFSTNVLNKFKITNTNLLKHLAISCLIAVIFLSGVSSTLLGFEYWKQRSNESQLNPFKLDALNTFTNKSYKNGTSIITSPNISTSNLNFTGATTIVSESSAAWESKSPELPLFVTRYSQNSPTYIYLHKTNNYQELSAFIGNYLEHLSRTANTYIENKDIQIKIISNGSIPTPQSSTALVIPYDKSTMTISKPLYQEVDKQYKVLSLFFNKDLPSLNFYKEPITYKNVEMNGTAIFNGINSYIRINGTDAYCNKILVEFEFQSLNLTRNQVIISKLDWGIPPQKSWEIAQYGKKIVFKISPDGVDEEVLQTGEILALNTGYTIRCEYDGVSMKIFINNKIAASKQYQKGIFKSNTDIIIGAELINNKPTAFANMMLRSIRVLNNIPLETESIFYAYDLFSNTGFNYTTILSDDNTLYNYKTLILPYDDPLTSDMLAKLNYQTTSTRYVIVLNTNGYGPLLESFGNVSSETFTVNKIFTSKFFTTDTSIEIPKIKLNSNINVKAQYVNNSLSSPLIMTTTRNGIKLIYINLYPLITQNQLLTQASIQSMTETLSEYMQTSNETKISPWFTEPSLLFNKLTATGSISITSNSIITNLTNINNFEITQINSTKITIQGGYGFYTALTAHDPIIVMRSNKTFTQEINGNITFIIRQPEISVNGEIKFENFYTLHPPTIYTDGRTTSLQGDINLHIYASDKFSIALPYHFNSYITVSYERPYMQFNETNYLFSLIPYILIVGIILLSSQLFYYISRTNEDKNDSNETEIHSTSTD